MSMDEELFDLKLVQFVEQNPHLYNKELRDFKNKIKRYKSWEIIGNALGTSGDFCERRWTVLRTRFAKEKRTEKEKISIGVEANCSPQWPMYEPMLFLSKHVKSRNSYKGLTIGPSSPFSPVKVSSITSDESLHENSYNSQNFSLPFKNMESMMILKTEHDDSNYERSEIERLNPLNQNEHSNDSVESVSDQSPKRKRRKASDQEISTSLVSNVKYISDYFRKKSERKEDPDYAFAKSVCMQLKEINCQEKKNKIKAKIMQCFVTESAI